MQNLFDYLKSRTKLTDSGCWEWQKARYPTGYGCSSASRPGGGYAHRAMYHAVHGAVPQGKKVCHQCDNPPCLNPAHLFAGTQRDNMRDMAEKGRGNLRRVYASEVIDAAIWARAAGISPREIHQAYGISRTYLYSLTTGKGRAGA